MTEANRRASNLAAAAWFRAEFQVLSKDLPIATPRAESWRAVFPRVRPGPNQSGGDLKLHAPARTESNQEISPWTWIILPNTLTVAITVLVGVSTQVRLLPFEAFVLLPRFGPPIYLGWFAFTIYKVVKRRNTHFNRQAPRCEYLTNMARELARTKDADVSKEVDRMEGALGVARINETDRSAALWAVFFLAGLVTLFITSLISTFYVSYFLMKDFYDHEKREVEFVENLSAAFKAVGFPVRLPQREHPTPKRRFVPNLILITLTGGISFYSLLVLGGTFGGSAIPVWLFPLIFIVPAGVSGLMVLRMVYVMLADQNNHIRYHLLMEERIVSGATPLPAIRLMTAE